MNTQKCDYCLFYTYDEEYGDYCCEMEADIDMDEWEYMTRYGKKDCPYFRINNEYKIVEKQN